MTDSAQQIDSTKSSTEAAKETGTEYSSHMTHDAKPGSHSELFGLSPQDKPTQNAGSGPGSGIEGTSGHSGIRNRSSDAADSGPALAEGETGGVADGSKGADITPAGAGTTQATPSQGSGKV